MGIKLADFNFHAFLGNIVLDPGNIIAPTRVRTDGIPHVLNLLYCKELIWMTALDKPNVRSYEAILNRVISVALRNGLIQKENIPEIPFYSEDELLRRLTAAGTGEVRDLLDRLITREPYLFLGSAQVSGRSSRDNIENVVTNIINESRVEDYELLVHVPFKDLPHEPDPWLNISVEGPEDLNNRLCQCYEAARQMEQKRNSTIKFFVADKKVKEKVRPFIEKEFRTKVS